MFNLAHTYFCLEQWDDAGALLTTLIEAEARKLGPLHLNVLTTKLELERVYTKKRQPARSRNPVLRSPWGAKKSDRSGSPSHTQGGRVAQNDTPGLRKVPGKRGGGGDEKRRLNVDRLNMNEARPWHLQKIRMEYRSQFGGGLPREKGKFLTYNTTLALHK